MLILMDVAIAYMLDLIFGDPYWLPHPVRFIGWLIKSTEKVLRQWTGGAREKDRNKREFAAGAVLTIVVVGATFMIVLAILKLAQMINPVLFHIVNIYFIYSALAARCLGDEALKVYNALKNKGISEARKRLAMLVGRETDSLSEDEVIRGVVETTAENTVDGEISPLIYAIIGSLFGLGAPLVYAFKAISTLDSMVGYMNDKYMYFGRVSAKLDDAANYIPARLSGVLIPISAALCGKSFSKSFSIMVRDRRNHKSPNCAYPEAAIAGALGVRLGGNNVYFGKVVEKPTIGDPEKELEIKDITDTVKIMYIASLVTLLSGAAVVAVFYMIRF